MMKLVLKGLGYILGRNCQKNQSLVYLEKLIIKFSLTKCIECLKKLFWNFCACKLESDNI